MDGCADGCTDGCADGCVDGCLMGRTESNHASFAPTQYILLNVENEAKYFTIFAKQLRIEYLH